MAVISKIDRAVTYIREAMVHIPVGVVALLTKLYMICPVFKANIGMYFIFYF
jgi:hypothetical protein